MFDMTLWTKEFVSLAKQSFNKEQSGLFINMFCAEREKFFEIKEVKSQFIYQIIDKRANYIGLTLSEPLKIMLMYLAPSPGSVIMYLYALRQNYTKATMIEFSKLFPSGILSEENMEIMWDKQKGYNCGEKADNCIDQHQF